MKKLLTLAILSLLSVRLLAVSPARENAIYRDSVYRHIIKDGFSQLNCYLTYPQGSSQVIKAFDNNGYELEKLDRFIHSVLADPTLYISKISLTGYCSIEGSQSYNMSLSKSRVEGFLHHLNIEYNLSELYPVKVEWQGEDWEMLRRLVSGSIMNERDGVVRIIDEVSDINARKKRLKTFKGGKPYQTMFNEIFPLLRRVNIKVEYDLQRIMEGACGRELTDEEFNEQLRLEREAIAKAECKAIEEKAINDKKVKKPVVKPYRDKDKYRKNTDSNCFLNKYGYGEKFFIGVKTNLVLLAGVTPDFEYKTFMPNLAAEVYFNQQWSVEAAVIYSYLNFDNDKQFWGVSGYRVEPRYWLEGNNNFSGLYLGAYGQFGDFDVCNEKEKTKRTDNYTGNYWQAGLSAGYYLQLSSQWGLEVGLRGGYQETSTKVYDIVTPEYHFNHSKSDNEFKFTGLNVSLTYRFR